LCIHWESKFRLPNASRCRELFTLHLPNPDRVTADYAALASLSRGLSGGDILNVCVNAIHAGSVDPDSAKWSVTQSMLERKIGKVKKAKAEHSGNRAGPKRTIGFQ
jgi:AAA+ superfamily predicted ATPase